MNDTLGWLILIWVFITAIAALLILSRVNLIVVLLREIKAQGGQPTFHWATTTTEPERTVVAPIGETITQEQADALNGIVVTPAISSSSVTVKTRKK